MENTEKLVNDLLVVNTKEEAIAKLEKEIQTMNNNFNIFGYTAEDLKNIKSKKEVLNKLKNG